MTLMERASAKTPLDASADDALLTSLREKVGQIIPPADAARLIASNPRQARSEISLACEKVIAGEPWLLAGRYSAEEVVGRYLDEVFGLGPLEEMLSDDSITEVTANNRTVPHKVKLNAKEEACLRDPYLAGTAEVIAGLVTTGPGSGLFTTAMTSYRLFTCMF